MLATPLALLGLLALPALAAIYWLRRRSSEQLVSTLFLWADQRHVPAGGAVLERLQTPLSFLLELLALALLALAAAGPMFPAAETIRPLYVVLDDSFSMLAGAPDSPRSRALGAIEEELARGRHEPAIFIAAGKTPRVLGELRGRTGAASILESWICLSPESDLEGAESLALELGRGRARVLVVTDHAPPGALPAAGRVEHRAFGSTRDNVAFVSAGRLSRDGRERSILEIQNFSSSPARRGIALVNERGVEVARLALELAPGERRALFPELSPETGMLTARLTPDALPIDDTVFLLPEAIRPVRVANLVRDAKLAELIERGLAASGIAAPSRDHPELVILDHPEGDGDPERWSLEIGAAGDARSFAGPFVIRRSHPLAEGLSLAGVVWGAGSRGVAGGTPIVSAGSVPLLSEIERGRGERRLRMSFRPELSTLEQSPDWPVLLWNLLAWRAASSPGARPRNVPLGGEVTVVVESTADEVRILDPDGRGRTEPARERTVSVVAQMPGVHRVEALEAGRAVAAHRFASNPLEPAESDLSRARSGSWGDWNDASTLALEYRSFIWLALLLAAAVLTLHWKLVGGRSGA